MNESHDERQNALKRARKSKGHQPEKTPRTPAKKRPQKSETVTQRNHNRWQFQITLIEWLNFPRHRAIWTRNDANFISSVCLHHQNVFYCNSFIFLLNRKGDNDCINFLGCLFWIACCLMARRVKLRFNVDLLLSFSPLYLQFSSLKVKQVHRQMLLTRSNLNRRGIFPN